MDSEHQACVLSASIHLWKHLNMSRTLCPINEQKYSKLDVMVFSGHFLISYQKKKLIFLLSNRCSNQHCMKDKTLKLWNCDLAATLNFRHSLMSPRENDALS
ncbi:hypothetical protein BDF14DRAFT_1360484 [Spinellus fusiger]|nr:hypothetical protein BDF14DRAFT_1360484 [Spinellus fusiger]